MRLPANLAALTIHSDCKPAWTGNSMGLILGARRSPTFFSGLLGGSHLAPLLCQSSKTLSTRVQVMMKAIESSTEIASLGFSFTGWSAMPFDATICLRRYLMNALGSRPGIYVQMRNKSTQPAELIPLQPFQSIAKSIFRIHTPDDDFSCRRR